MPKSIPTARVLLGTGASTARSVWMLAYHRPQDSLKVMFFATPSIARLLR